MSAAGQNVEGSSGLQDQLDRAGSQLALYARDLKRSFDAEKQRARELAEANERLKSLDRLKTDFLTFISHELRSPLTIMAVVAEVDPQAKLEELAWQLDVIRNGYERLKNFIERGLQYFSWKARDRVSQTETVDLAALARDAAARLRAGGGPVRDVRVTATGGACLVQGSARDLAEVIEILLDNALKFSPGDMQVRVELAEADGRVALAVTDLGTGFAPELAREVFRPFTIADVVHHSRGTGLSLALAAAIIDAHGGSIRAQSEGAGKGARFTVEVPACR